MHTEFQYTIDLFCFIWNFLLKHLHFWIVVDMRVSPPGEFCKEGREKVE